MNFRCRRCHNAVWARISRDERTTGATCDGCGQAYELTAPRKLNAAGKHLASKARNLAREHRIDMPGAYSVLLGIMSLEEVQELSQGNAPPGPDDDHAAESGGRRAYDPAFAEAVSEGHLTPFQARQRGRRKVYAEKLGKRHKLSDRLALEVADNRKSLLEAIRQARSQSTTTESVPVKVSGGVPLPPLWTIAVIVPLAVVGVMAARSEGPAVVQQVETSVGETRVVADTTGQVLQVSGPNPRSVLRAYCRAGNDPLEEVGVIPASARLGRARLGLLRRPSEPRNLLSIVIREDPDKGVWVTGDGNGVVRPNPAPDGAERSIRGG